MSSRRIAALVAVVIGAGLALAPVGWQMFTRAPKGGDMIVAFRPYVTPTKISAFQGYLREMGAADADVTQGNLAPSGSTDAVARFHQAWPGIDADMGDMLTTIRDNIGNFRGVSALPPFALFPYFFLLPGLFGIGFGVNLLWRTNKRQPTKLAASLVLVLGLGVLAAPAMFQMFGRAPGGKEMIDDFRPLMTDAKVTRIQGYFLTLGTAEGQFRTQVLPGSAVALPGVEKFSNDWPKIANEMSPMIGAMADNLDNYAAVDALPPFSRFPWFFVVPALILIGVAVPAVMDSSAQEATSV